MNTAAKSLAGDSPQRVLTERFGSVTISVEVRDIVRNMARQALSEDEPINLTARNTLHPRIGDFWEAEGGIYAGRLIDDQDRVYALVVARSAGEFVRVSWQQASTKAAALDLEDYVDWTLPNRMEALAMYQRLHERLKGGDEAFAEEVYWTSEQSASDSGTAWGQGFYGGGQGSWGKDDDTRARAVRRVVIQ